jgi:serine/threonine protein kinase
MEELFSETVTLSSLEPFSELPNPEEPKTIGSGIVTSTLGKGGAAVIYEIWNPKLEIHRAVKLWRPTLAEKNIQRFETEMKITAKLRHPNIVEIHAVGEWNNLPFIEIEKIDGCSLKELLKKKNEALPIPVAAVIGIFVCRALTYAHNHEYSLGDKKYKGVIHCDIKPANIMISDSGVVKLTDFGIALPSHTPGNSEKNKVTGSLQYMAPEQLASKEIDVRTDIFSLGVVLYELFSGSKAFTAHSFEELIETRRNHQLIPIKECAPKLPSKVISLIEKCIEITPDDRIQTVQEVMSELERIYSIYSIEPPESLLHRYLKGDTISVKPIGNKAIGIISTALVIIAAISSFALFFKLPNIKTDKTKIVASNAPIVNTSVSRKNQKEKIVPHSGVNGVKEPTTINPGSSPVNVKKLNDVSSKGMVNKSSSQIKRTALQTRKAIVLADHQVLNQAKEPIEKKIAEPVSDNEILDELWKLVRSSEYRNAERMFVEFPINDAEYFLVYSEFLLKKGNFEQARINAEKAMQMQARRMDPSEVRARCFYLKAKGLSEGFNQNPDSIRGQKAMDAWFDVKFQYRSNTNSSYYIDADKEIRRISSQLQK